VNNDFLNFRSETPRGWGYAVFGTVIEGMDVVDKIRHIPTSNGGPFPSDVPQTPVIIESASIDSGAAGAPPMAPAAGDTSAQ
jgi:cyclophilin family peptidyl-prolyl cis-trans isomerase